MAGVWQGTGLSPPQVTGTWLWVKQVGSCSSPHGMGSTWSPPSPDTLQQGSVLMCPCPGGAGHSLSLVLCDPDP